MLIRRNVVLRAVPVEMQCAFGCSMHIRSTYTCKIIRVRIKADNEWETVSVVSDNPKRLVFVPIGKIITGIICKKSMELLSHGFSLPIF